LNVLQQIFYGLALLCIPLAIILDKIGGVTQHLLFFLAAVAIFPLAALLVHATEQLASWLSRGSPVTSCERSWGCTCPVTGSTTR
jgi:Ca2+/H+ antiporter